MELSLVFFRPSTIAHAMVDKEKLIGLVFVREAIWNKKNKYHHNCVILNKLWKEVAEGCGVPATSAKAQWKRLRQTFIKKLSEQPVKRSGDGVEDDTETSDWPFFKSLLFLKDSCAPRKTEGNFSNEEDQSGEDTGDESSSQAPSSVTESVPLSTPASPRSSPTPVTKKVKTQRSSKKDHIGEALIIAEREKIEYLKRREENRKSKEAMIELNSVRKELDEDESFFKSILPHVRQFSPKRKMQFRIKVLQLVHDSIEANPPRDEPHITELVPQNQPSSSNPKHSSLSIPSEMFFSDLREEQNQNAYLNNMYPTQF
ncbi:transcription factor Adf-1-like [Photinus pyralis]|nr:transcription factor Adf-1-like [Photinus pyralis]XP_031338893.1 transcription factor Adf-1-like [Photinus pyralis]